MTIEWRDNGHPSQSEAGNSASWFSGYNQPTRSNRRHWSQRTGRLDGKNFTQWRGEKAAATSGTRAVSRGTVASACRPDDR